MKSLAKRVEDRYQSAAAMRADIERYLAGQPVVAPVVPVGDRRRRPADDAPTSMFGRPRPPTRTTSRSAEAVAADR